MCIVMCYSIYYYVCTILYTNSVFPGDTGGVHWFDNDNIVILTRPSVIESEDVISKLIKEQQTGKE